MQKISSGLAGLARELGIEEGARLNLIKQKWDALAGERLAQNLHPWKLADGVLTLRADSPLWLEQANFFKQEIIGRLKDLGVKDIRFTAGRIAAPALPANKQPEKRAPIVSATVEREVEDKLVPIRDEELKHIARSALIKAMHFEKKI
ncbi:MAG: DUF721 domain-containing protein [Actinomycetota bacterium]|nr:DUF721 domain-containing protein [Actinomycetota bacterium]